MLLNLQTIGQSLWMDYVAREIIYDGSLLRHIKDSSITGLSLNPEAVCQTLNRSDVYDSEISFKIKEGKCGEALVCDLILEDVCHAADLVRHVFDKTDGVDGWVSFPVSPLMVKEPEELKNSIIELHSQIKRPNVLITVNGFLEHSELIQELLFAGIPINISLICSHEQYINAANAYIRAIEKRINKGLNPAVPAFISISISHLLGALSEEMTRETAIPVTIAVARKIYRSMQTLHTSHKWERAYNCGARFLRLIWVNSVEEQKTNAGYFIANHLIAPLTVTSLSAKILTEFSQGEESQGLMPKNGDDCDEVLSSLQETGFNFEYLATNLQKDLAESQIRSWIMLLDMLARKSASIIQNQT